MALKAKNTEHAGAKHAGDGYGGRRRDAKHDSNRARRSAGKAEIRQAFKR